MGEGISQKAKHTELSILTSENWEKIEMLVQNVIQAAAAAATSAVSSGNWISEHRKEIYIFEI